MSTYLSINEYASESITRIAWNGYYRLNLPCVKQDKNILSGTMSIAHRLWIMLLSSQNFHILATSDFSLVNGEIREILRNSVLTHIEICYYDQILSSINIDESSWMPLTSLCCPNCYCVYMDLLYNRHQVYLIWSRWFGWSQIFHAHLANLSMMYMYLTNTLILLTLTMHFSCNRICQYWGHRCNSTFIEVRRLPKGDL